MNVGEQLVSDYLECIKECDFIQKNLQIPENQGEIDVIGINLKNREIYVCEVAIHLTVGLQYTKSSKPNNVDKICEKLSRDIEYTHRYFPDYKQYFMFWTPVVKNTQTQRADEGKDYDTAIQQILSKALISDQVIDIFAAAGLQKPDLSILSDEFLLEVRKIPHKNLAFEMLRKLLNDEIKIKRKKNLIQARSFAEMLERAVRAYNNKSIETAEIIEQLIELAKRMKEEEKRGDKLGLDENEIAFYDALVNHEGVKEVMGDELLMIIARELVEGIRNSITIDWTIRDNVQAMMRLKVKKILRKYGYPPDKQQIATDTVLEQAKLLCKDWAAVTV